MYSIFFHIQSKHLFILRIWVSRQLLCVCVKSLERYYSGTHGLWACCRKVRLHYRRHKQQVPWLHSLFRVYNCKLFQLDVVPWKGLSILNSTSLIKAFGHSHMPIFLYVCTMLINVHSCYDIHILYLFWLPVERILHFWN